MDLYLCDFGDGNNGVDCYYCCCGVEEIRGLRKVGVGIYEGCLLRAGTESIKATTGLVCRLSG